ncbi:MAG: DUF86 domain-containing protein [Candidatus Zambryskibacteria bacterium]|nr:DUF86 domain-containing protein [Candidatus Zambryskibacteria bacterium]
MNRTALQDYLSIENFCEIVNNTEKDIASHSIEYLINDDLSFSGILYRTETLGEIAKNLSTSFTENFPQIPWSDIARTRDIIVHHYHDVDPQIIRKILEDQIPILSSILPELKKYAVEHLDPDDQKDIVANQ